jgi:hypothetical protein
MSKKQSLYNWCLENNIRLKEINNEDEYFLKPISQLEFDLFLSLNDVIKDIEPIKPEKFLELRMYGFVPYNISEIQKGIQFGHAVVEYGMKYMNTPEYQYFANEWKTFIILNGGTSNDGSLIRQGFRDAFYEGSLNTITQQLYDNGVKCATFREPDLNNMLTSVVFLVDERVWNRDLYADFTPITIEEFSNEKHYNGYTPTWEDEIELEIENKKLYGKWVTKIGGEKNVFLRGLLKDKRLA